MLRTHEHLLLGLRKVLELRPGAVIPLVWVLLVAVFFGFVIRTSNKFHSNCKKPD